MEKQWAEWQEKMELAYKNTVRVVRNYDSSQLKISAWQSFLRNWNSDNQYSQQDEELRKIASDQLSQLLSKSEKSMDSPIKKGGISEKIEPEISIINNLKTTDKWTEWQLRMQEDFDERVKFESQPVLNYLKKNSWDSFLEKWIEDNPFSDEDDSLRQRANLKAKSYSLKKNIPNNSVADWEKLLPKPDSKIRTAIGKSLDLRNKQIEKIQNPKSVEDQIGNSQNSSLNKNQAYSSRDIVKQNLNQFLLKQAVKEYETKSRRAPQIYDEEKRWRDRMGFITDEDQDSIKSRFFQNLSEGCPNNSC